jgi:hypothetical protein
MHIRGTRAFDSLPQGLDCSAVDASSPLRYEVSSHSFHKRFNDFERALIPEAVPAVQELIAKTPPTSSSARNWNVVAGDANPYLGRRYPIDDDPRRKIQRARSELQRVPPGLRVRQPEASV